MKQSFCCIICDRFLFHEPGTICYWCQPREDPIVEDEHVVKSDGEPQVLPSRQGK